MQYHSGGDRVVLGIASLTSSDLGPRLYHESGTGHLTDLIIIIKVQVTTSDHL